MLVIVVIANSLHFDHKCILLKIVTDLAVYIVCMNLVDFKYYIYHKYLDKQNIFQIKLLLIKGCTKL